MKESVAIWDKCRTPQNRSILSQIRHHNKKFAPLQQVLVWKVPGVVLLFLSFELDPTIGVEVPGCQHNVLPFLGKELALEGVTVHYAEVLTKCAGLPAFIGCEHD
jgi:hypothetical protein